MQTPDETAEEPEFQFFDDRIGPLEGAIIEAALEYERAWTKYAHRTRTEWPDPDIMVDKGQAHQTLLDAVRAYQDMMIEENN